MKALSLLPLLSRSCFCSQVQNFVHVYLHNAKNFQLGEWSQYFMNTPRCRNLVTILIGKRKQQQLASYTHFFQETNQTKKREPWSARLPSIERCTLSCILYPLYVLNQNKRGHISTTKLKLKNYLSQSPRFCSFYMPMKRFVWGRCLTELSNFFFLRDQSRNSGISVWPSRANYQSKRSSELSTRNHAYLRKAWARFIAKVWLTLHPK